MPSHAVQPGTRPLLTPAISGAPGRHRQLPTYGRMLRKVIALAEKLGRTATMAAMLLLTAATLLLMVHPSESGATGTVPAASYNE